MPADIAARLLRNLRFEDMLMGANAALLPRDADAAPVVSDDREMSSDPTDVAAHPTAAAERQPESLSEIVRVPEPAHDALSAGLQAAVEAVRESLRQDHAATDGPRDASQLTGDGASAPAPESMPPPVLGSSGLLNAGNAAEVGALGPVQHLAQTSQQPAAAGQDVGDHAAPLFPTQLGPVEISVVQTLDTTVAQTLDVLTTTLPNLDDPTAVVGQTLETVADTVGDTITNTISTVVQDGAVSQVLGTDVLTLLGSSLQNGGDVVTVSSLGGVGVDSLTGVLPTPPVQPVPDLPLDHIHVSMDHFGVPDAFDAVDTAHESWLPVPVSHSTVLHIGSALI